MTRYQRARNEGNDPTTIYLSYAMTLPALILIAFIATPFLLLGQIYEKND